MFMKANPSKFWKSILSFSDDSIAFIINDRTCTDPVAIPEGFNLYFHFVLRKDDSSRFPFRHSLKHALPDLEVTHTGIHNLLLKIDTAKNAGPDAIPNMFLKRCSE